jgi:hypothetical protein
MPPSPLRLKNVLKQQSDINLLLFNAADGNTIALPVQSLLRRNTNQAVLQSALVGKTEASNRIVRQFSVSEECSDVLLELDLVAQIASETAQGSFYNLDELFERIDQEYFGGKMLKPRLIWSGILSSRKLGHYERTRDRVVISQILDDRRIPSSVVEFILYHELLHKHHGIKWVNGRCLAHTPEFRHSEGKFRQYQEAESFLKQMAVGC